MSTSQNLDSFAQSLKTATKRRISDGGYKRPAHKPIVARKHDVRETNANRLPSNKPVKPQGRPAVTIGNIPVNAKIDLVCKLVSSIINVAPEKVITSLTKHDNIWTFACVNQAQAKLLCSKLDNALINETGKRLVVRETVIRPVVKSVIKTRSQTMTVTLKKPQGKITKPVKSFRKL